MSKFKVMAIHDIHVDTPQGRICWAYARRTDALTKYAPPDFHVDTFQYRDVPWRLAGEYDLIYQTEYAAINRAKLKASGPNVPIVVSYNSDSRRRQHYWTAVQKEADYVVFNNLEAFNYFGRPERSYCISNGVDISVFRSAVPIAEREHRCIFAGSTGPTKMKGWPEVFRPLEQLLPPLGFITDFRPVDDINPERVFTTDKTVEWYNSASYVLIASLSEGTPNLATEAVAAGCVLVTVPVGNVLEWGRDRENCVLSERNADAFVAALQYARENRERLGNAGMKTIRDGWSYGAPGNRADYFFNLFRRIIEGKPPQPFSYSELQPEDI